MPRCRPLLTAALPFAAAFAPALTLAPAALLCACGPPDETTALRALATLRARVALTADAVAARVEVRSWVDGADGEPVEHVQSRRVAPTAAGAAGERRDAYAIFAVEPGEVRVVATPLDADDRLAPGCAPVEVDVLVAGTAWTEVELAPPCDGAAAAAAR